MHVRVLTFNVWNSEGDPRRIDLINRGLRELDPDLVALQEVSAAPAPDQLERLLAGTNLQGTHQAQVVAIPPPGAERYGGNAIATRWPHRIVEALDLRQAGAPDVPWCTLAARVSLPELGDLLFHRHDNLVATRG
jgi:endonuclease/exonuclease/phosphatase family metal-dependent hydrolase